MELKRDRIDDLLDQMLAANKPQPVREWGPVGRFVTETIEIVGAIFCAWLVWYMIFNWFSQ